MMPCDQTHCLYYYLEISLVKLYCDLKALLDKDLVKGENFNERKNSRHYLNKLTPAGFGETDKVDLRFLFQKQGWVLCDQNRAG